MGTASDDRDVPGIVAEAWQAALGLEGPEEGRSFLALGGDSLRAQVLRARLIEDLGIDLPLAKLIDCDSVATLTSLVAARGIGARLPPAPPTSDTSEPEPPRLSFSQERLFFLHELSAASAAYHVAHAIRLRGPLDTHALHTAFKSLLRRHPCLQSGMPAVDMPATARARVSATDPWRELTWLPMGDEAATLDSLREYLCELSNAPFDLAHGPLLRGALIRLGPDDAVLLLATHHVAADQWSFDLLLRELSMTYTRLRRDESAEWQEKEPSYAAYTRWHRQWFEEHRRATEQAFWLCKLQGLEPLTLYEDYPRPPQQSFRGRVLRHQIGPREIAALRTFGAARGASLAMVMLAALKLVLARHTGSNDVAIGVPVSGRHHPHSRAIVGPLLNTVVVRTDIDQCASFNTTLQRVRASLLEALENQDMPLDHLVKVLQLPRDASRAPLFGVMFNMLNTPIDQPVFERLHCSWLHFDKRASQADLQVTVDVDRSRSILFEYATELYYETTIHRFAQHYLATLRSIIAGEDDPIELRDSLLDTERRQLANWSHGRRIPRFGGSVVSLLAPTFSRMASKHAVHCGTDSLTYAQLNAYSDDVAKILRHAGIGRGDFVGICIDRSISLPAAVLGVLKSGAAYVPLDPAYPIDRLAYMARDAGLALLMHDGSLPLDVPWPEFRCGCIRMPAVQDLGLTSDPPQSDSDTLQETLSDHTDAAYVIYTSGSSGLPKGVVVSHGAVQNFLRSMAEVPGMTDKDRLLAITTLSFDISVLELLLPLFVGAEIIVATRADQTDAEALGQLITRHCVSVMQGTPSTWRLLIDSGWAGAPQLRALVGGEPLVHDLAIKLLSRCSEVWNMYGPTETTVWSTCHRVEDVRSARIPIGRPIANTSVWILDDAMNPCPIGVPGEIYIGGDGLAQGYLRQPSLTEQRFRVNSGSRDRRTSRLYRTGDRGRWTEQGVIEHLGRVDLQIKLRGYRVEPGEIETRLLMMESLRDAVVIASETALGDVRLVAYVVPRGRDADAEAIQAHLRAWLPDYMRPQHIEFVAEIPRLPNGKLNRSALPAPSRISAPVRGLDPPRTDAERALHRIWCDLLGHHSVGICDNFFELGGHSLLAVQMVARIREELHRACSLPMLFRHPTIETLALALKTGSSLLDSAIVPLNEPADLPVLFCLCGISIYRDLARALTGRKHVIAINVPEELGLFGHAPSSPLTIERLAARYVEEIRRHGPHTSVQLCGFSFGGVVAYEVSQQLRTAGCDVALLWILDSDAPIRRGSLTLRRVSSAAKQLALAVAQSLYPRAGSADPVEERRLETYRRAMAEYRADPSPMPLLLVKSRESPTFDAGTAWSDLAPRARIVKLEVDHMRVLAAEGIALWLPGELECAAAASG